MRRLPIIVIGLVAGLTAADPAAAIQSTCLAGKTKCVSKKAFALLKCEWKARTPGRPADPNDGGCVDKAIEKFDGGCFEKLEERTPNDCITVDDTQTVEAVVDQCVADLVGVIDPMVLDQSKCYAGKHKCAAQGLKKLLKCHQKAQTPGMPAHPNTNGCLDKAREKLDGGAFPAKGCVEKLEDNSRNDCILPMNNQDEISTAVDACVAAIVGALGTSQSTSTSTTSTTTSSTFGTSTTSTTLPGVECTSANGFDVTVSIDYNVQTLGSLSAIHLGLNYPGPLVIPGSGNATTVRTRVTPVAGSGTSLNGWNDHDTNSNAVDDVIEVNAVRPSSPLGPGPIIRVRFDCPLGTVVPPSSLSCFHSGATDNAGNPIPPAVEAAEVSCSLALAPAP